MDEVEQQSRGRGASRRVSVAPQCWSLGGRSSCGTVEREGVRNLHEVGLGGKVAFVDDIGVDVECAVDAVVECAMTMQMMMSW